MAEVDTVPASPRESAGKGSARMVRRNGMVPAVIYGSKKEPVLLTLERRILDRELDNPRFFIRLIDVELDGNKHRVLPRDVQFHPVSDAPLHVDFLRFDPKRKITVAVPVSFDGENDSPGLKRGGVLNVVRYEVEVLCTADNIPQELLLHIAGLDIGDSVHASSVTLGDGVEFAITDRDFTIATISAPTIIVEPVEDEDEEGDETEAGEGETEASEDSDESPTDEGESDDA